MTFSRYNPSGYAPGNRLPAACVNQHDEDISNAIDGGAGGTYTPSSAITIGGAGLGIAGPCLVSNTMSIGPTGSISIDASGTLGAGERTGITATAYSRTHYINATCRGVSLDEYNGATDAWTAEYLSDYVYWKQNTVGSTEGYLYLPLDFVPLAASITTLTMQLKGASGHAGLPTTMPRIALVRQAPDGSGITVLDTAIDDSEDTTEYQAVHPVTLSGLNAQPISYVYMVRITGEFGTNAATGLSVYSVAVTWSTNSIGL